jgi:hypothetical protein
MPTPSSHAALDSASTRTVNTFLGSGDGIDLASLASWLDALDDRARAAAVRSMTARQQARLYEAVQGFRAITLDHVVPAAVPSRVPVIHTGKNSLHAFTLFEKRFCRPEDGATRLWGYNEVPRAVRAVAGPGHFVCYALGSTEVLVDYCELPPAALEGWPALRPNSAGLSRFIYNRTKDTLRGVSRHVSIGRAAREGRLLDNWFVLCRHDGAPLAR